LLIDATTRAGGRKLVNVQAEIAAGDEEIAADQARTMNANGDPPEAQPSI